jgi:ribose transport system ATP-binding protein
MMLKVNSVSKSFPGVKSLDRVDFAVAAGEVRALVGENGAGKSTLIKVVAGVYEPEAGTVEFDGRTVRWASPHEARDAGIHVIYQELALFPELTVAENIFIGEEPRGRLGLVDYAMMERRALEALARLGITLDPWRKVGGLSVADQQMVEIAKALVREVKLLILDEPTAVISGREVELLFAIVERLRREGVAVVYVSHRLEEVFTIADTVTVLKDGRLVGARSVRDIDRATLVSMMVGRQLADIYPLRAAGWKRGGLVLRAEHLSASERLKDVSFELYTGEVLGVAGMVGAGRTDLAHAIFGSLPLEGGRLWIDGTTRDHITPAEAIALGIGFLTEDRKAEGLFLQLDIAANVTVPTLRDVVRHGLVDGTAERAAGEEAIVAFTIAASSSRMRVANLSGGNQQKVLIGRWVRACRRVLILDEPTRGVDVGAKMEIYRFIRDLADQGVGVLMISSELPEIIGMSDRVIVMREGVLTGELRREELSEAALLGLATTERREAA